MQCFCFNDYRKRSFVLGDTIAMESCELHAKVHGKAFHISVRHESLHVHITHRTSRTILPILTNLIRDVRTVALPSLELSVCINWIGSSCHGCRYELDSAEFEFRLLWSHNKLNGTTDHTSRAWCHKHVQTEVETHLYRDKWNHQTPWWRWKRNEVIVVIF